MLIAEMSAVSYFLSTTTVLACAATVLAFVVGTVLAIRRSSRRAGKRVLLLALLSVPVDLVLLILLALADAYACDTAEPNNADAPNVAMALRLHSEHHWRGAGDPRR